MSVKALKRLLINNRDQETLTDATLPFRDQLEPPSSKEAVENSSVKVVETEETKRISYEAEVIKDAFDANYYLLNNVDVKDAGLDPLLHFLLYGWKEGRNPSEAFSVEHYLKENPDVREAGINPFWHYLVAGKEEGRSALPRVSIEADPTLQQAEAIRDFFDSAYYLRHNPDVAEAKTDPLLHFLKTGWKEGRNPSEAFSVEHYLKENPDIREAGINPFWHYLVAGKEEGRSALPRASTNADPILQQDDPILQQAEVIRGFFDSAYYLRHNPDVAKAKVDPLLHFLKTGWREGRNPCKAFSVAYYLEANPDVQASGINPFWHYVVAGKAEGRSPQHPGGYRAETLIKMQPLEEIVRAWQTRGIPPSLLSANDLCHRILSSKDAINKLVISVGHDNYREVSGGVQYCIQHEEELVSASGGVYLNLHPYQPLPRLAHTAEDPDVPVALVLDGKSIGTAQMSTLTASLKILTERFDKIEVIIHSLLGHSPEQIAEMVQATGEGRCRLWLHDFFTICPNYALQRNNVSFCGAPVVTSNACELCLYGAERRNHLKRISALFDTLDIEVVAPSQFAADFWTRHSQLRRTEITVRPHAAIEWAEIAPRPVDDGKIVLAFVGYPAPHKGWPVFEEVVRAFRGENSSFRFLYFGTSAIGLDQVETVAVHVTADDPDAMVRALTNHKVDLVLHWATCAETFSFSTHEALAAGAYVLTSPISGNVAATVHRLKRGAVLSDEAELMAFLGGRGVQDMILELRDRRRQEKARIIRSEMTTGISDQENRQ